VKLRELRFGAPEFASFLRGLPRGGVADRRVVGGVARIIAAVRAEGDAALRRFTEELDGVTLDRIQMPASRVRALAGKADPELRRALAGMARRIEAFHVRQKGCGFALRLPGGGRLEEVVAPLDSAGLYVPGGAGAYPSSVLMNAIPARVAGVPRLAVVTPPRTLETNPAVAAALVLVGLEDCVYAVGGAQAVAALAFGTASVPAVAKIVGPGNAWVAEAKRQVRGRVETDRDAGPSEIVVLADRSADAGQVACDLLAQAEHGSGEETAVLVTDSEPLAAEVQLLIADGLGSAANPEATRRALRRHGAIVRVRDLDEGIAAVNAFSAEHVEVITRRAAAVARRIIGGAVFVGPWAPVAVGDYGVGPNHVLPTGGAARAGSPLSVRDFERRSSRVTLTRASLARVADDVARVADAEGFRAHALSVRTRFEA
jgi:histidinol dehydrogenase